MKNGERREFRHAPARTQRLFTIHVDLADCRPALPLRGEVVQVVDLRLRLGLPAPEPGRRTRIIVLHGDDDRVAGILVDAVREVVRVPEDDVRPATGGEADAVSEIFLAGEDFVSILNLDRVLDFCGDD